MIEIIGKNGSGKTYIANELSKMGHKKIIGYTTRAMRTNEVDKIDYNFINKIEFESMINNDEFVDYKIRNNEYYGIRTNDINNDSIIISGNSNLIAKKTGFKVYKLYLDASLDVRYKRMINRNPEDNLFERIHSESFSFLDDFQALFINNEIDDTSIIKKIDSYIEEGTINLNYLKDNKKFIQEKIKEYDSYNDSNTNDMLRILKYEEYLLRKLSLNNNCNKRVEYYKLIKEYLNKINIEYQMLNEKILLLNNKDYYLDYKEKKR